MSIEWVNRAIDGLRAWGREKGLTPDVDEVRLLCDYASDYLEVHELGDFRPGTFDELLLEIYPRKVIAGPETAPETVAAARTLVEFLVDTGEIATKTAAKMRDTLDRVGPQMPAALADVTKYGMAKSIFSAIGADALDDPEVQRLPVEGDSFEGDEDDCDCPGCAPLPAVRLASRAEVAAAVREVPLLLEAHAVVDWLAGHDATATTRKGLRRRDARLITEELGVERPAAAWRMALDLGLAELHETVIARESAFLPLAERPDDDVLDLWIGTVEFLAEGGHEITGHTMVDGGLYAIHDLLYRLQEPVALESVAEYLREVSDADDDAADFDVGSEASGAQSVDRTPRESRGSTGGGSSRGVRELAESGGSAGDRRFAEGGGSAGDRRFAESGGSLGDRRFAGGRGDPGLAEGRGNRGLAEGPSLGSEQGSDREGGGRWAAGLASVPSLATGDASARGREGIPLAERGPRGNGTTVAYDGGRVERRPTATAHEGGAAENGSRGAQPETAEAGPTDSGSRLEAALEALVRTGTVRLTGAGLELTAHGVWGLREMYDDMGVAAPIAADLAEGDAGALISGLLSDGFAPDVAERDIDRWLAGRQDVEAAAELLAAVSGAPAEVRGVAVTIVDRLGPEAEPAVRDQLQDAELRPHAIHWLSSRGFAAPPLTESEMLWVSVDMLALTLAAAEADPDNFAENMAASGPSPEVIEDMWRVDHPDVVQVLELLGRTLPDRTHAKAARKAAFKARSRGIR